MNSAMTKESLEELFDQVTREVTEQAAGISLRAGNTVPDGKLCTVYARFERGFHTSLSLCADETLFARLTRRMMREEDVTPQDVEDFTKEYFNVLCGCIASRLFRVTKVPSRFGIPSFYRGRYEPDGHQTHFIISYISDGNENAQLTHHTTSGLGLE